MEFAEFLRKSMKLLHMSQRDMATVIGMSNQSVSFYVSERQRVPDRTKIVIAHKLSREFVRQIEARYEKIREIQNEIDAIEQLRFDGGEWL